jgi:RNA polymerase sigma factor (sigma-70 family)
MKARKAKTTKPLRTAPKKAVKKVAKPAPKSKSKSKLISKSKRLTPAQYEAIILENREHGRRLAWSFLSSWRIRLPQDEVVSIVGTALCESAIRFDPSRNVAFKTFFFYHLRGLLLKEISRMIRDSRSLQSLSDDPGSESGDMISTIGADVLSSDTLSPEQIMEKQEVAMLCEKAAKELDSLEYEVVFRHFVNDESLSDISKQLSYCRCHISRVKSRGLKKLRAFISPYFETGAEDNTRPIDTAANRRYKGGRGRRKALIFQLGGRGRLLLGPDKVTRKAA